MKKLFILAIALLFVAGSTSAVTISLHSSNQGITYMNYSVSGTDITIWEDWGASGIGMLEISDLEADVNYTVTKEITNYSTIDWNRFAIELLDPAGNDNDYWDIPSEAWVPDGFSHSTEYDGLSFAQGSGIPRTSNAFANRTDDELGGRDYMDFFDGLVFGSGGGDIISFGLRDYQPQNNQPFILAQRPNEATGGPEIPEPTTMLLFGLGLVGVALRNKFRK